jgi:NodT family efflux transporter outer membrane factor (OMF) lipoprotein
MSLGCKVGPHYAPPATCVPETWNQELPEGVSLVPQHELLDTSWWTVFRDPALDQLVFEAANSNLELRSTGIRIVETRAQRAIVAGGLFPWVDAKASYTRNQISTNGNPFGLSGGGIPGFGGFQPFDIFSTGFDASWELDLFGQVRRAVEAADADIGVAIEDHRGIAVSLFAEVATAYVEMRTLQEQIQVAEKNAEIQNDTVRLTKERFDAGKESRLPLAQATSTLRNTQAAIPSLRSQLRSVMHRLCVLRAQVPRDLEPELGTGKIPKAPSEILLGLPISLIRQRPDVRRAEREMAAQTARVGVAVADLYPDVSLTGTFTLDSVDFGSLFDGKSIAYRLTGPALRWKILYFGRIRNNIRVQDAKLQQAMLRYENTVLRSLEEVENALNAYVELQQRLQYLEQAVTFAEEATKLSLTRYDAGSENFQPVLDAQKFQLVVEEQRASTRGNVALRLIALYKALGGGWQYRPFTTMSLEPDTVDQPADMGGEEDVPAPPEAADPPVNVDRVP